MKHKFILALFAATMLLTACSNSKRESGIVSSNLASVEGDGAVSINTNNVTYSIQSPLYNVYDKEQRLVDAAENVVLGKVTGVSFQILGDKIHTRPDGSTYTGQFYTVYDVDVLTSYKGSLSDSIRVRMYGGIKDLYLEEQLAALGERANYGIPVVEEMPVLNIGETYLLVLNMYSTEIPTVINPVQGVYAVSSPVDEVGHSSVSSKDRCGISIKDIISYFGEEQWSTFKSDNHIMAE